MKKLEYAELHEAFDPKFKELMKLIRGSAKTSVFTGAGVSTLSGIPDFRGKHGVYTTLWHNLSVEEILNIDFFYEHPDIFYRWAGDVWYHLEEYEPNIVHLTLAKMEKKGYVRDVFTQNIDFMHQRAGSENVYELHGSARHAYCTRCHKHYDYKDIAPIAREHKVPYCNCGSPIKPDIVFYGEALDHTTMLRAQNSFENCSLCLILGSSLTVYPASTYPALAIRRGIPTVVVNAQQTGLDSSATLCFKDLEQVFSAIAQEIEK